MLYHWRGCPESIEYVRTLSSIVTAETRDYYQDVVVCVGGDGTLLQAIRTCTNLTRFLPINLGTRGYLMNRATPAKDLAEAINQKLLHAYQFPRLHDGHRCALNEIAVVPAADQSVKLHVSIDGVPVSSEPVIGSGVLVATGAGSTGWNMAAGGSARHALSADLSLTFINAYSPRVPPMVVPFDSRITVTPHERNKRPARTRIDGVSQPRTHEQVFHIDLSGTPVEILYMPDHNFTRRMIAKVIR